MVDSSPYTAESQPLPPYQLTLVSPKQAVLEFLERFLGKSRGVTQSLESGWLRGTSIRLTAILVVWCRHQRGNARSDGWIAQENIDWSSGLDPLCTCNTVLMSGVPCQLCYNLTSWRECLLCIFWNGILWLRPFTQFNWCPISVSSICLISVENKFLMIMKNVLFLMCRQQMKSWMRIMVDYLDMIANESCESVYKWKSIGKTKLKVLTEI